uniref:Uncharacterized protein n=1 Tax=Arundo donax TaxID=35708 RepID=A0A0A9AW65_ARUDO
MIPITTWVNNQVKGHKTNHNSACYITWILAQTSETSFLLYTPKVILGSFLSTGGVAQPWELIRQNSSVSNSPS